MSNSNQGKWMPKAGEQANGVAERANLTGAPRENLINSSKNILGAGINPKTGGRSTGLVVGYVQSGKTLSFTTVIGLARDNGFPLVIVIAGNKDNLLTQSHQRLTKDLDVDGGSGLPAWIMEKNPRSKNNQHEQLIRQAIDNWSDDSRDADEKPTVLLTVLKQNQRLSALTSLLKKIGMSDVPTLVIDDEADQASLNNKVRQGEESTTYTRLCELRDALPSHTFLQYTATPQAPLLINIADTLSPDFVRVLDPGEDYVGGSEFFRPNCRLVEAIPQADIITLNNMPEEPPPSLLSAFREFFVGLAASIINGAPRRSMLIHPARERVVHQEAALWATSVRDTWQHTLELKDSDLDRIELVDEFRGAYESLISTAPNLPPFDAIVEKLPKALRNTVVIEFNTRGSPKTPEINWRHARGWILVGGQAVDRGFTVESLTVTYMPRGIGVGNADTLQQRARFFGYKRRYLGLCRVYLEAGILNAFENYVEHEEFMRSELKLIQSGEQDLKQWRRRLVLDPALHPCRRNVLSDSYTRSRIGGGWVQQRGALMTKEIRDHNSDVIDRLIDSLGWSADDTYPSTQAAQQHLVSRNVPLETLVEALVQYRMQDPRDTASFTGLLVTFGEALRRDPTSTASVYQMRPNTKSERTIEVSDGTIENFQQGATKIQGGGITYPGDGTFKAADSVTLHINKFELVEKIGNPALASAATLIAVHAPPSLAKNWLVQLQSGQS